MILGLSNSKMAECAEVIHTKSVRCPASYCKNFKERPSICIYILRGKFKSNKWRLAGNISYIWKSLTFASLLWLKTASIIRNIIIHDLHENKKHNDLQNKQTNTQVDLELNMSCLFYIICWFITYFSRY